VCKQILIDAKLKTGEVKKHLTGSLYPPNVPRTFKAASTKRTQEFKCPAHSCNVEAWNDRSTRRAPHYTMFCVRFTLRPFYPIMYICTL
jgi:hypothetical protein